QQIIAHESGVADTVDPLGGAYVIEQLTDEIEQRAAEYLQKIDVLGGALKAIEAGYIQAEIQEAAYRYQRAVERKEQIVVGVNELVDASRAPTEVERLKIDPAIESQARARLSALRAGRDTVKVSELLTRVEAAARSA